MTSNASNDIAARRRSVIAFNLAADSPRQIVDANTGKIFLSTTTNTASSGATNGNGGGFSPFAGPGDLQSIPSLSPSMLTHKSPSGQSKMADFLEQRRPRRVSVALAQSPRLRQQKESTQSPSHTLDSVGEGDEEEEIGEEQHRTANVSIEASIRSHIALKSCAKYRFTTDELKAFLFNGDASMCVRRLRQAFLWRGSVAFQHFCSLISFGKDFNSPSRKVRREACMEIFAGLAGLTASRIYAEAIDLTKVEASIQDLVIGLKSLSQRWLLYTNDELYSLAFLLDINERGRVSWADFFDFCLGVHEAHTEDVRVLPAVSFENLYADLMKLSELYAYGGVDVTSVKGAAVRGHGGSPSAAARGSEMSTSESMIIVKLTQVVATARDSGHLPLTDLMGAIGAFGSEIGVSTLRNLLASFGCSIDSDEAVSPGSPARGSLQSSKTRAKGATADLNLLNPDYVPTPRDSSIAAQQHPQADNTLQNLFSNLKTLKNNAFSMSQKLVGQQEGLESTMGMWESIHSIEKDISSLSFSRSDTAAVSSSSAKTPTARSSSSPKKRSSISKLFNAMGEEGGAAEASSITADPGPAVSELVHRLQAAKTPSPARTPAVESSDSAGRARSAGRSRPSVTPPTPLHIAQSSVTARRKQIIKSTITLSSNNSHIALANSSNNNSNSKSASGRAQINTTPLRSRPSPGSRSGTPVRATPGSSGASPSFRSGTPSRPQSRSSSGGERPVNLSIFKSPMERQLSHPNRNVYDENTFQWQPTARCNKYSERFQTTSDLMEGRKIFSVFYQVDS